MNLTTLGGYRIFLQQSKVSSVDPTSPLNFQIDWATFRKFPFPATSSENRTDAKNFLFIETNNRMHGFKDSVLASKLYACC